MDFVLPPAAPASLPIVGSTQRFAIHRIYCVARNYADHAQEMGDTGREPPFFFLKPADVALSAVSATDTTTETKPLAMPYPSLTQDLHHEVELVVALGQGGSHIAVEDAFKHVWGYAVGLDMTRRDLQAQMKQKGRPWCIAKGFDASAPMGALTPAAQATGMDAAAISLQVNGQLRQSGNTAAMIWSVAEIIATLSQAWQSQAGDIIMTGTPAGVGECASGRPAARAGGGAGPAAGADCCPVLTAFTVFTHSRLGRPRSHELLPLAHPVLLPMRPCRGAPPARRR